MGTSMAEAAPNAELLRSLGRLVRGLSALFWGLPAALIVCAGTGMAGWFGNRGWALPPIATGFLLYGLWHLGTFQKQERPWRSALDRARLLALVNLGLSPFLYWWNRVPEQPLFRLAVGLLALSALLFLFNLNLVIQRLGAMLPDETLQLETRQFTTVNRVLCVATVTLAMLLVTLSKLSSTVPVLGVYFSLLGKATVLSYVLTLVLPVAVLVLLPLAITMALIWKTKEVVLDSVFDAHH
jgi:hypothetical protein